MKLMKKNDKNIFNKIAGIFIHNGELGVLVILFIVAFGLFGFILMPKQYNPEIVAPAFRINTVFPNSTAEEVYELVTRPMEDKLREIKDVDDIYSQSSAGFSSVLVTFEIGSDESAAKIDLVQRLRSNMDEKPLGAKDPFIEEVDTDDVPILTLALTSDKLSETALRSFAFDLSDKLKYIKNTAKFTIRGGRRMDVSVFVDFDKMNAYGVGINEIIGAISQNNVHLLTAETDSQPYKATFRIFGNIEDAQKLNKIIVKQGDNSVVRVEDVARVEYGPISIDNYVRLDDKNAFQNAVYIGIAKQNGSNAINVSRDLKKEIDKLYAQKIIPDYVDIKIVRDDGVVAGESISGLTKNLITSIVIVISILLLFLNTRSALVVAVAIPLSLLSVFGLGLLFGQTINRITLFALILSLGLLVDNATVVVENMYRHLKKRKGEKKSRVIIDAVSEVSGGLIMSTITTVLAFIPMAFVTGMMGPYMGPIPFFVPAAIVASLFVALTISPFIGNLFLQVSENGGGLLSGAQEKIRRFVTRVENGYVKFIQMVFASRKKQRVLLMTVGVLLVISMLLPAFGLVKFRMLPKADRNQFYVYIDLMSGSNINETDRVARNVEEEILRNNNVVSTQATVGIPPIVDFNGMFKGSDARRESNQATIKVNLVDKKEREKTSENIATEVRESLRRLAIQNDANIKIIEDPPGPPVLSTYQLKVQGEEREDYAELKKIATDLMRATKKVEGVVDVDISRREHSVEKTYRINMEEANRVGVSVDDIMMAMNVAMNGQIVSLYHDKLSDGQRFAEQHFITVRADDSDRKNLKDFAKITVQSADGKSVSLISLLREDDNIPLDDTIRMDSRKPTVYVDGEMQSRSVVYASIDMLKYLVKEYRLPDGQGRLDHWNLFGARYIDQNGHRYTVLIAGEWELTLEVFRDMGIAFAVAIFMIYFVLVAQFKSLRIPLYIMATIPLALIGVLPGFLILYILKGTYFNATSMIGVIALAGIVVNNAIIYLEYVFQLKEKGFGIEDALVKAGQTRLLPIALTSLTTILGSLTIISDPVWEGLAWAIITGLSLSAFLTLVVLPVIYRKFEVNNWGKV